MSHQRVGSLEASESRTECSIAPALVAQFRQWLARPCSGLREKSGLIALTPDASAFGSGFETGSRVLPVNTDRESVPVIVEPAMVVVRTVNGIRTVNLVRDVNTTEAGIVVGPWEDVHPMVVVMSVDVTTKNTTVPSEYGVRAHNETDNQGEDE